MKRLTWLAVSLSLAVVFTAPGYTADSAKKESEEGRLKTITLKLDWRHGVQHM